ncbi:MAG: glycoside hydrolase family 3 protein [Clostridia bacterium]|nr:glycoside hydrolase family 3 protein [Clostridia bacterium]
MKRWIAWALALMILCCSCPAFAEVGSFVVSDDEEEAAPDLSRQARALMRLMTDDEKIGQLFFVSLEDLTGEERSVSLIDGTALSRMPVGGVMIFGQNIVSEEQLRTLTGKLKQSAGLVPLFIGVDEEGGNVSRVANKLGYPLALSPEEIGKTGDEALARSAGEQIAAYLTPLGINMTFAPSADTFTDLANAGVQAYGSDPYLVSRMAAAMAEGLKSGGVAPCYTHFPGHGEKTGTTLSALSVRRTLEEMRALEFIPFRDAAEAGAGMILVSHAAIRAVGDDFPASTSSQVIKGILRGELGFEGAAVTDSLRMSAVTSKYKKGQESVAALKAGADILLLPPDVNAAFQAVKQALRTGEITMARVEESVERILKVKIAMGWFN